MRADRRVGAAETCLGQAGGRTQITPLWRAMPHHVPLKATGLLVTAVSVWQAQWS